MAEVEGQNWQDGYWSSADGLRLHYREYPAVGAAAEKRPVLLCLHGLTRNARDFEGLAARLAGKWRVIAVDLRGRGRSEAAKDAATYTPGVYVEDVAALIAELGIDRYVAIGTSLGGIVTMLLAAQGVGRIAGAVLNDVGPEIDPAGLARIRSYLGKAQNWPTWMHAARALAEANADIYPDWQIADWLVMAKRLYRLNSAGRIVLDYDMRIAEPFRSPANVAAPDMWGALGALAEVPVTIVRGASSDILSAAVAARMKAALPKAVVVTVPRTGHAPTLEEPVAAAAVDRLLARVARGASPSRLREGLGEGMSV